MNTLAASPHNFGFRNQTTRGSVLLTALIFAAIIGISITSYLQMSTNSLKLAHRTFFANAACNLAEAGTEEAVWSFNKLGYATDSPSIITAWNGWTLGNSVTNVDIKSLGSGYTSAPTVTFTSVDGNGGGAAGTATITTITLTQNGSTTTITGVTGVTITSQGSGYTLPPTVTFSNGGGSGATGTALLAATRTFTFNNLDQNATGAVKVWVDGYDGNATVPIVVSQATITPYNGPPITKMIKIIISKNGVLPKGLIAEDGITFNGHPLADSFISSAAPGVPPFSQYDLSTALGNITVGSLSGTINLGSHGVVNGNVDLGPGVTLTGGTVTGQTLSGMTGSFTLPYYPTNSGDTGYYDNLGSTVPAILPRAGATPDQPAADGNYYYFVHGATIGTTTITAGKKVVIVGDSGTSMAAGLQIGVSGNQVGSATIYMDGPVTAGSGSINTTSWAGALTIYTSTTAACTFGGNSFFCGILYAPNSALTGNGGGSNGMDLCGSFIVNSVTSDGHMNFHYDQNLASINPSSKAWGLSLWKEMQSASDRALYASQLNF